MKSLSRFLLDEVGQGMVEFAIAGGLFSTILVGIFEFGYSAWAKNNVAADAREGARYAIVHGAASGNVATATTVSDYVKGRSQLGNSIRVYATWPNGTKAQDDPVVVSVAFTVPRRGLFIPTHTDSATSRMRIVF